ncbi:MAG TPA: cation:proton antiporter [Clostridiaceae bacterium]|nr:cation:proton antiporter [Clostridiaceae bacterium]
MNTLLYISIVMISGLLVAKLASYAKLPDVTGYLVAGLIIGPGISKLIPQNVVSDMGIISEAALGIIAFSIGSEFSFKHIKKLGSNIISLTVIQALGAYIAVALPMILIFGRSVSFGLLMAAIAVATAPAATVMVVKQYKAKGPLVNVLLPLVAIDDAIGIIIFGITATTVQSLMHSGGGSSLLASIALPIWEILLAVLIGLASGMLLSLTLPRARDDEKRLVMILAIILLDVALANLCNVSSLLLCMTTGAVITNMMKKSEKIFALVDRFSPPIYVAFFTISGASLDIEILKKVGLIGIAYVIFRSAGKICGAYFGAKALRMPETIQKYLGITLLPQAGVAIGLSIVAQNVLPEYGAAIRTIVLGATFIYELVGPVLAKIALLKAGEIDQGEIQDKSEKKLKIGSNKEKRQIVKGKMEKTV